MRLEHLIESNFTRIQSEEVGKATHTHFGPQLTKQDAEAILHGEGY